CIRQEREWWLRTTAAGIAIGLSSEFCCVTVCMILVIMIWQTDLYSMTKPHSSVDNSYSFHRSIPLLLMDMSGI
ncbi:unnamed protein product, partial [Brassica rapa subsp. narinosa]